MLRTRHISQMGTTIANIDYRQQYQKIKKQTMAELNGAASAGGAAAGSTTPRKQGRANGASQSSNGKRKGAAAHEDEEDEEVETSPPKKSMVKHESKVDHALVTKVEQEEEYVIALSQKLQYHDISLYRPTPRTKGDLRDRLMS